MEMTLIVWSALSFVLVCQVRAQFSIIDLPCIQRLNQLYCKDQGTQYPTDRIDQFIDLNKALTRRMFGDGPPSDVTTGAALSESVSDIQSFRTVDFHKYLRNEDTRRINVRKCKTRRFRRSANDTVAPPSARKRSRRDSERAIPTPPKIEKNSEHRVDSCESKMEIMTPFWAENSSNDVRVIVNTKNFPQAIRVEICSRPTTRHCSGNCICEQKYTWYRLLAYDPDNDCKGIFIDWFLYPSCCVCRCKP